MRRDLFILAATALAATTLVTATQLPLGNPHHTPSRSNSDPSFPQPAAGFGDMSLPGKMAGQGMTLADTLTVDRRGSLWWEYARDVSSITARLQARGNKATTILVPVDSAIMRLSKKPHQNPNGEADEQTMKANVRKFIEAHIIPTEIELPTNGGAKTLLEGMTVEIRADETKEGGWKVDPGDIEVLSVKDAANGKILYLNGVIQP